MSTTFSAPPQPLVSGFLAAASFTLFLYDYLLTFDREVRFFWMRGHQNVDATRVLYIATRYLAMFTVFASFKFFANVSHRDEPYEQLDDLKQVVHWTGLISILSSEGILIVRTYALWSCKKRVAVILVTLLAILCAIYGAILGTSYTNDDFYVTHTVGYALSLGFEFAIITATLFRQSMHLGMPIPPLLRLLYKDRVGYILCIFAISLVNLVMSLTNSLVPTQIHIQYISHSIFSTRIILPIRQSTEDQPRTHDLVIEMSV